MAPGDDWRAITSVVERGLARRLYPGAVVVVGRGDSILYARGFGRTSWARGAPVPDPGTTRWDVASLTKVVATASAIAALVDEGRVELDEPVSRYLPRFAGGGRDRVTVRMLLDHTSGLPPFAPLYREPGGRVALIEALFRVPLARPAGQAVRYSDLNAMLLGLVVEAVSRLPLDRFASEAVFAPLGMRHTGFAVADRTRIAPSVITNGRAVPGVVSDPNARAMGGIAGHAGLFATGLDLARFAQAWLTPVGEWLTSATLRQFLERRSGARALGWETPDPAEAGISPYGRHATSSTFGHTGWTGTFLWFDPVRDVFLVFLTNRSLGSNGRSSLRAMRDLRARLSDAVASRVGPRCVASGPC
jgi:CubicO group peptidase (beta-lactamase class C family)